MSHKKYFERRVSSANSRGVESDLSTGLRMRRARMLGGGLWIAWNEVRTTGAKIGGFVWTKTACKNATHGALPQARRRQNI
jgi:hypothetical protein